MPHQMGLPAPAQTSESTSDVEEAENYWLNIGVAFPHKDGSGFTVKLQAIPLDGKIVCREIARAKNRRIP